MHIKKGDKVIVITGKDKGKSGTVTRAMPQDDRVVVSGINMHKVHKRATKSNEKGQIIEQAAPIHVSNVRRDGEVKEKKAKAAPKAPKKASKK